MNWTSIEQIGRMAAATITDGAGNDVESSSVVVTLRRVAINDTDGARWTASVGCYSSKACKTTEEALEEVAGMYRSVLLAKIAQSEKQAARGRAALPADPAPELPSEEGGG